MWLTTRILWIDTEAGPDEINTPWRGHLYLKLDIILVKIVIRAVFQDQAMYLRTSFRCAKSYKIRKQGVFLTFLQIWERA